MVQNIVSYLFQIPCAKGNSSYTVSNCVVTRHLATHEHSPAFAFVTWRLSTALRNTVLYIATVRSTKGQSVLSSIPACAICVQLIINSHTHMHKLDSNRLVVRSNSYVRLCRLFKACRFIQFRACVVIQLCVIHYTYSGVTIVHP